MQGNAFLVLHINKYGLIKPENLVYLPLLSYTFDFCMSSYHVIGIYGVSLLSFYFIWVLNHD